MPSRTSSSLTLNPSIIMIRFSIMSLLKLIYTLNHMKRDNITPSPIYFSPPSPNITFSAYNHRLPHRESLPLDQHIPINRGQEFQQRYSNTIDSNQPNNAFAHLRNQISNLRSEFTKLIQKDGTKDEKVNFSTYKKEERVTAHSTIGFYNQNDIKAQNKPENKNDLASLKNRLAGIEAKNSNEDGKTKKDESSKYQKKYSFQVQDKKDENVIILDTTKISELQVEIRKLGEIRFKVEEENIALKKQMNRMEKEIANKNNGFELQNERLKKSIQQAQISISLKNSLVEKLESEHQNFKQLIKHYESQNSILEQELQNCRNDLQATKVNHKNEMERMHQRHQQQVKHVESIHQTNINEILNQLVSSQKEERYAQLTLSLKEDECQQLRKEKSHFLEQCQAQISVKTYQINTQDLKSQGTLELKTKVLEDENTDLKKRVESYKKTVEQLNSSNNSGREKLLIAKEEAKKYKEEAKFLAEELSVKQKLITSLYRDINILDAEIRHNALLKPILASNSKYIEELNQHIVELQCERLNARYREMADFSISPSF